MIEDYNSIKEIYEKRFGDSIDKIRNVDEQFPFILYALKSCMVGKDKSKDVKVLDAGCGDGRYMFALKEQGYKYVYGFDLFDAISEKKLNYKQGSLDSIPFGDSSFDVVYCSSALYYLKEVEKGVRELVRVTRHGGVILCTVTTKFSLYALKRHLNVIVKTKGTEHLDHYHFQYSIFDYKHFFEDAGCTVALVDGFRMPISGFIRRLIRKVIRILSKNPDFDFERKITRLKPIRYIKALFGYHAVIMVTRK